MTKTTPGQKQKSSHLADQITKLFLLCQEKEARFISNYEISTVEFRCLRILEKNDAIPVSQLAREMSLTSSRITRISDGLVEKQLVKREAGTADRRVLYLSLTKEGKKIITKLNTEYARMHDEILANITEKQHQIITDGVAQLIQAIEEWIKNKEKS